MINFDEFLKQDDADKYNMLQECNAIIQQKENIIKEVREYIKFELEDVLKVNRYDLHYHTIDGLHIKRILEILDKEVN